MTSNFSEDASDFKCDNLIDSFHTRYVSIHGWASLIVCLFGSIANGLNIAVLTRREMTSPTNAILTGLAVADMLVMMEYIPYAFHSYLYQRPKSETFTYGWAVFVLVHSNFAQIFHTISIWLTVTLAVWRYIAVAHPQKNRQWCSYKNTIYAIIGAYIICPIICVPLYVSTEIRSTNVTLNRMGFEVNLTNLTNLTNLGYKKDEVFYNVTLYMVKMTESAKKGALEKLNFLIYGVVIKLIPCVALTILSLRLILALVEAKKRRKKLTNQTIVKMEESNQQVKIHQEAKNKKTSRCMDKEKQTDRTTRMLLAVLLLFLITEFPQGTMGLLSILLGESFFKTCYLKLGKKGQYLLYLY